MTRACTQCQSEGVGCWAHGVLPERGDGGLHEPGQGILSNRLQEGGRRGACGRGCGVGWTGAGEVGECPKEDRVVATVVGWWCS
jgi:hypothetical protein